MTVSYQYDVASSSTGGFFRLLWRWRGSIWKLLYKELLLFCAIYLFIAFSYDFLMTDYYKRYYERIVIFCSAFVEIIPLSFILGFYVSFTATRWWQQYTAIPWPDKLMNIIALYVPGNDVTSRVIRRTLMRYLNLTLVLVLRSISIPVKRRFPTKEHLVEAGFMSRPELEMYSSVPSHEFNTFWIPCTWFVNLLREAKSECRITDSGGIKLIMEEFNEFRSKCGLLWSYDWVSIPLVYTQVVTLSTQAFFLASLLGRQHINPPKDQDVKSHIYGEYYIPVFTLLQFILYMGLLKLGEQLINPFGDDDEDFELNWIIDRHLKVSFLGVDILNADPPPLIKDNYFDDMDIKLPYTEAAVAHKVKTYRGSVAAFHVPTSKHGLVIPEFEDEENGEDDDVGSTIQSNKEHNVHTSSWSLFKGKRKLSSSIDSFNSETMVERGLDETERPTLQPNSSWPTFLMAENASQQGKHPAGGRSVWPKEQLSPEGTQGIRGSEADHSTQPEDVPFPPYVKDRWKPPLPRKSGTGSKGLKVSSGEIGKQSSFESTDSSVIIPMGEEPERRASENSTSSKLFSFRKSPLQVFSKEFGNAPMSAFKVPDTSLSPRNSGDRSSLSSSLSLRMEVKPVKQHKSLMKCNRTVDPKLRIRPFHAKVTFSEDTKTGDAGSPEKRVESKYSYFNRWDSSSDSVSSMLKMGGSDEPISLKRPRTYSDTPPSTIKPSSTLKLSDISFGDVSKRRQSLDPKSLTRATAVVVQKTEVELTKDNWLHYQSLPNIQEEEQLANSPTDTSPPPPPLLDASTLPETNSSPTFPLKVSLLSPETSNKAMTLPASPVVTPNILSPQLTTTFDQSNPSFAERRRRSLKRQKSQDHPDEEVVHQFVVKLPPPPPPPRLSKQPSDESQTSNSTTSSTNQPKGTSSSIGGPSGILRRRKEDLKPDESTPRQASTESDTASYHTVSSYKVEKSNSSSIDSFTSAISESNNVSSASNSTTQPTLSRDTESESTPVEHGHVNGSRYHMPTFTPMESSLVPTIIFSQSTPSVTSQSSDDQNSPKWDERSNSMEKAMEAVFQKGRPELPAKPASQPTPLPCDSLHLTIQGPDECPDDPPGTTNEEQSTASKLKRTFPRNHTQGNGSEPPS